MINLSVVILVRYDPNHFARVGERRSCVDGKVFSSSTTCSSEVAMHDLGHFSWEHVWVSSRGW